MEGDVARGGRGAAEEARVVFVFLFLLLSFPRSAVQEGEEIKAETLLFEVGRR